MRDDNREKQGHLYTNLPLLQRELLRIISIGGDGSFTKTIRGLAQETEVCECKRSQGPHLCTVMPARIGRL